MRSKITNKRSAAITWVTGLALVVSMCVGILTTNNAEAARGDQRDSAQGRKVKIATDLRAEILPLHSPPRRSSGSQVVSSPRRGTRSTCSASWVS